MSSQCRPRLHPRVLFPFLYSMPRLPYCMLAFLATRLIRATSDSIAARSIIALGPQGTCPAAQETLYELQPVYYSNFLPHNTIIDPLHNGNSITITNAPTALIFHTYITVVVTQQGHSPSDGATSAQFDPGGTNKMTPMNGGSLTLSPPTLRGPSRFSSSTTSSNVASIVPSPIVVDGQTITAGAAAVTIHGTPVS